MAEDHEEGAYAEVEHKENVYEVFLEVEASEETQPEAEDVDEGLPLHW